MILPIAKQSPSQVSFKVFVFRENKVYCLLMLAMMALQFVIFKLCYPFPDFFSDSYSYIEAAWLHLDVNIWPIGYSRFLALFHWFTTSGLALVSFQYFVYSISALYFYLTITYFHHTGRNTRIFLCIFLFFNPLFLYLANYVTSDMLFVSMSIVWLTQVIWILRRPKIYHLFVQALLMGIMFTFRYNAMLYPIIAAVVFLLSRQRVWIKVLGIITGPALIIPFILWQSHAAKVMTGTAQFPPILGGWQWGNNALYMRGFITEDSNAFPTLQTAELDRIARKYFSQPSRPQDLLFWEVANFFIRHYDAPLKQYMGRHYHPKTDYEDIADWGKSAVVFDQYGKFLIKRHPWAYARYYLLVNTKNYFAPPLEKLEIYNLGFDEMWPIGQHWFKYASPKVWCISKPLQGIVLSLFPISFLLVNIYYVMGLFLFIRRNGIRRISAPVLYTFLTMTIFLALNAAFSIFANIIVIRYEIFPMLVFLTFAMLLTDYTELLFPAAAATIHRRSISSNSKLNSAFGTK
jgi:4-amino-4-deoxy-L-arabinose transferase-like glycosyltransferase